MDSPDPGNRARWTLSSVTVAVRTHTIAASNPPRWCWFWCLTTPGFHLITDEQPPPLSEEPTTGFKRHEDQVRTGAYSVRKAYLCRSEASLARFDFAPTCSSLSHPPPAGRAAANEGERPRRLGGGRKEREQEGQVDKNSILHPDLFWSVNSMRDRETETGRQDKFHQHISTAGPR